MNKFAIIADDLTGSVDTSAYFGQYGVPAIVSLDKNAVRLADEAVHAVNAATREEPLSDARQVHLTLGRQFKDSGRIIIKKTDMGFRGNHGAEIEGLLEGLGAQVCYLLNAIPNHRAFILDAQQYVKGKLLPESMYAQDPSRKPTTAYIPEILQKQTALSIGTIGIDDVRSQTLAEQIRACVESGHRILVFDAVTDEDCLAVVRESLALPYPAIWAGTLGLIDAMAQCSDPDHVRRSYQPAKAAPKCLCFTTSNYDTVRRQIRTAADHGLQEITLNMDACIHEGAASEQEIARTCALCREANAHGNVILTQTLKGTYPELCVPERILAVMAECARRLTAMCEFDRLVIIGGETSAAILRTLGITRLQILALPETGTALGRIDDGALRGKSFAAKGGSVGTDEALLHMLLATDA